MAFDRTDSDDLAALKAEVNIDPLSRNYAQFLDPFQTALFLGLLNNIVLNDPRFIVSKPKISSAQVRSTVTFDAYNGLVADEQEWLRWITGSDGFEEENMVITPDARLQLTDAEGDGTNSIWAVSSRDAMNAAMLSLIDVPGSRGQVLFGFDTTINVQDWLAARVS